MAQIRQGSARPFDGAQRSRAGLTELLVVVRPLRIGLDDSRFSGLRVEDDNPIAGGRYLKMPCWTLCFARL